MTTPIRVVLVDDHPIFRDGLLGLLQVVDDIDVVGEAGDGETATEVAIAQRPDVVVMDVNLPGINGVEATRRIVRAAPGVGVLVLTMFDGDDTVFDAVQAGARGYLLKGAERDEILRAVRAVAGGEAIFGPALARRLIGVFGSGGHTASPLTALTEREREVLELVAAGAGNAEIAKKLFVAPKTVRNHVSHIFAKLQAPDRAQAILRARQAGLGRDPLS